MEGGGLGLAAAGTEGAQAAAALEVQWWLGGEGLLAEVECGRTCCVGQARGGGRHRWASCALLGCHMPATGAPP